MFELRLQISTEKRRNLIALDEAVVKANKKRHYIFSAASTEKNEIMRVYTIREAADDEVRRQRNTKVLQEQNPNSLSIKFFVEVLKSPI